MQKRYPEYHAHLQGLASNLAQQLRGPTSGFARLHREALADGLLSTKIKELIALAIAISLRCDGCITCHVHDALRAGATREEVAETVGVAVLMGGGPAMIYGAEALEAVDQFLAARDT